MPDCQHRHKIYKRDVSVFSVVLECSACRATFVEDRQKYHGNGVSFTDVNGNLSNVAGYVRLTIDKSRIGLAESIMDDCILVRFSGEIIPNSADIEHITGSTISALYKVNPRILQMVHGVAAVNRRQDAKPRHRT